MSGHSLQTEGYRRRKRYTLAVTLTTDSKLKCNNRKALGCNGFC
nr:MAG TPA: hypothetical protein [Caudoviricetes sp.]